MTGSTITRGVNIPALDRASKWAFKPIAKPGDAVVGGDVLGTVEETSAVSHKIMVPPGVSGTVSSIEEGEFTVEDTVCVVKKDDGTELAL